MGRGSNKQRYEAGSLFAHFVGLNGIGGKREMVTMLFYRTKGDVNRPGSLQPLLKFSHGHFFNKHKTNSNLADKLVGLWNNPDFRHKVTGNFLKFQHPERRDSYAAVSECYRLQDDRNIAIY